MRIFIEKVMIMINHFKYVLVCIEKECCIMMIDHQFNVSSVERGSFESTFRIIIETSSGLDSSTEDNFTYKQ